MSRNYSRLWILLVLCIGMSIAAPVTTAPTQSENITRSSVDRSDNNERFGPTTISSLVVAVLGAVFGLLSLVPLWMWWMMRIRCKVTTASFLFLKSSLFISYRVGMKLPQV